MRKIYKCVLGVLALTLSTTLTSEESTAVKNLTSHSLSLNSALTAAQASIENCDTQGISVSVSVVDTNGLLRVLLKADGASPLSATLSQRKAFTAANFGRNTILLADLSDTAVGRSEGVLMSAGGVLIKIDEINYGAIGVSGADSGAKDDECAKAGVSAITAILSDLKPDVGPEAQKEKETVLK